MIKYTMSFKVLLVPRELYLSVKDRKNAPSRVETIRMNNSMLFLSDANKKYVTNGMYSLHKKFGGGMEKIVFIEQIPKLMLDWSKKVPLDDMESLNDIDWMEILHFTNDKFMKKHYVHFKKTSPHSFKVGNLGLPEINVFREDFETGEVNKIKKKGDHLTAEDIKSMDVWEPIEHYRSNDNFRCNNKLRIWQKAVQKRNYDRSNEGLRHGHSKTASRVVPQRGYDMSAILDSTNKYDNLRKWEL